MPTTQFTLAGQRFDLSTGFVRETLVGHQPRAIKRYWVDVDGVRWPVKQVVALATGLDSQRFDSRGSRRILTKLGFPIGRIRTSQDVILQLRDASLAVSVADFVTTKGPELHAPGMYGWWVDEAGAQDLSEGLGQHVAPGLIYAGMTGAGRADGASSTSTLWRRIVTKHLGKRHQVSTLRRSLGSILAHSHGLPAIDEAVLTQWMYDHLRVIAVPVSDTDTLNELETDVLNRLDPPLNLAKVDETPVRHRLSALRNQFTGLS